MSQIAMYTTHCTLLAKGTKSAFIIIVTERGVEPQLRRATKGLLAA